MSHMMLEQGLNKEIIIVNEIFFKGEGLKKEIVQGILRKVGKDKITIEQYLPFVDYLEGNDPPSILRDFDDKSYRIVSNIKL